MIIETLTSVYEIILKDKKFSVKKVYLKEGRNSEVEVGEECIGTILKIDLRGGLVVLDENGVVLSTSRIQN